MTEKKLKLFTSSEAARAGRAPQADASPAAVDEVLSASDLDRIEAELSTQLPAHYRAFMRALPRSVLELRDANAAAWEPHRPVTDDDLLTRVDAIVDLNKELAREKLLPADTFVVGENGAGDYWVIERPPSPSTQVTLLAHDEDFEAADEYDDLDAFLAALIARYRASD